MRAAMSCNRYYASALTRSHEGLAAVHQSPVTVPLVVTAGSVYPHLRHLVIIAMRFVIGITIYVSNIILIPTFVTI